MKSSKYDSAPNDPIHPPDYCSCPNPERRTPGTRCAQCKKEQALATFIWNRKTLVTQANITVDQAAKIFGITLTFVDMYLMCKVTGRKFQIYPGYLLRPGDKIVLLPQKREIEKMAIKFAPKVQSHYIGYVYGIRYFRDQIPEQVSRTGHITGAWNGRWYSPRQTARCKDGNCKATHGRKIPAPHKNGLCGINMYRLGPESEIIPRNNALTALTKGWGKVIELDRGYRVQKAELVLLYHPDKELLRTIINLPGFKQRGTKATSSQEGFTNACKDLEKKIEEQLVPIPREESTHEHAR